MRKLLIACAILLLLIVLLVPPGLGWLLGNNMRNMVGQPLGNYVVTNVQMDTGWVSSQGTLTLEVPQQPASQMQITGTISHPSKQGLYAGPLEISDYDGQLGYGNIRLGFDLGLTGDGVLTRIDPYTGQVSWTGRMAEGGAQFTAVSQTLNGPGTVLDDLDARLNANGGQITIDLDLQGYQLDGEQGRNLALDIAITPDDAVTDYRAQIEAKELSSALVDMRDVSGSLSLLGLPKEAVGLIRETIAIAQVDPQAAQYNLPIVLPAILKPGLELNLEHWEAMTDTGPVSVTGALRVVRQPQAGYLANPALLGEAIQLDWNLVMPEDLLRRLVYQYSAMPEQTLASFHNNQTVIFEAGQAKMNLTFENNVLTVNGVTSNLATPTGQ